MAIMRTGSTGPRVRDGRPVAGAGTAIRSRETRAGIERGPESPSGSYRHCLSHSASHSELHPQEEPLNRMPTFHDLHLFSTEAAGLSLHDRLDVG